MKLAFMFLVAQGTAQAMLMIVDDYLSRADAVPAITIFLGGLAIAIVGIVGLL
jgi:hypothetical protein